MAFALRWAEEHDEPAIKALVRATDLNPLALHWQHFLVAEDTVPEGRRIVGIGQIKVHGEGSRELASIATVPDRRGEGIATTIIEALLVTDARISASPLYLTCRSHMETFYERFGFRRAERLADAPAYFRRLMRIYRAFTVVSRLFGGQGGLVMVRERT